MALVLCLVLFVGTCACSMRLRSLEVMYSSN